MLLGPSGVGKTLMAKTLARVLDVPFSMSDCTPFTQAGYIGEDADVCVQRLLSAANYDVSKAEQGIICLDEIDKIATAKMSHGRDVGGEGVQQALLKIIEGTTLQIQAKPERANPGRTPSPTHNPLGGGGSGGFGASNMNQQPPPGKAEIYNVRTDNILFICTGAFVGLHKQILDRISKGSIGFGANVRSSPSSSSADPGTHETTLIGDSDLFQKHLPYFVAPPAATPSPKSTQQPNSNLTTQPKSLTKNKKKKNQQTHNTLDLVEPHDLQKFGLIPELVGRIPITCALSALDIPSLVKVLSEPRNSLLKQYEQLFSLSSIDLRFTTPALFAIAETAASMGTGARGLRTVVERLLSDVMFEAPGSAVKFVAVTEDVARRVGPAQCFSREQREGFRGLIAKEEEEWEERRRREEVGEEGEETEWERRARVNREGGGHATTFEEYRQKASAAGFT